MPDYFYNLCRILKAPPRVGMVLIVRDESRFLDLHLRYHHWLGVERAYCYEHRCVDSSGEIAGRFPWVQRIVLEGRCPRKEAYISELHRHCMNDALERARRDGLDWLLIIDADEFAAPDGGLCRNGLPRELKHLPETILEARLRTREVLACAEFGETNWHENPFFAVPERTRQPLGNGAEWTGHLGHSQGQGLVRTRAPVQAYDSHRWTAALEKPSTGMPPYRPLPAVGIGWHAHYYLATPEHWLEKFTRHNDFPQHWPAPGQREGETTHLPLEQPVAVWRECVAELQDRPGTALAHARASLFRSVQALTQLAREDDSPQVDIDPSLPAALRPLAKQLPLPHKEAGRPAIHLSIESLAPPPTLKPAEVDLCAGNLLIYEVLLHGFHDWEGSDGTPFRWSEPKASVTGELPAGRYQLKLRLRSSYFRHNSVSGIQLQTSGQAISLKRHFRSGWISGHLHHPGGAFSLHLNALQQAAPGDPRRLGLPLIELLIKRSAVAP